MCQKISIFKPICDVDRLLYIRLKHVFHADLFLVKQQINKQNPTLAVLIVNAGVPCINLGSHYCHRTHKDVKIYMWCELKSDVRFPAIPITDEHLFVKTCKLLKQIKTNKHVI